MLKALGIVALTLLGVYCYEHQKQTRATLAQAGRNLADAGKDLTKNVR